MGANIQFDEKLPTIKQEAGDAPDPWRQVEVYTWDNQLWLRIGAVNQANAGTDRYTVALSKDAAAHLIAKIEQGVDSLGH